MRNEHKTKPEKTIVGKPKKQGIHLIFYQN